MDYRQDIIVTVDIALLVLSEGRLSIGLLRRPNEPFSGRLALPGGFVHPEEDDDLAATAARVLREKTGIVSPYLEQLFSFSGAVRDPRGWSLSVCYYALVPGEVVEASSIGEFELVPVDGRPPLPFDHDRIVDAAIERLRGKATYSTLPAFLLPETFTLAELQSVYEHVLDTKLDKSSFRKKVEAQGIVEPVKGVRRGAAHRPAQLYRLSASRLTEFDRRI